MYHQTEHVGCYGRVYAEEATLEKTRSEEVCGPLRFGGVVIDLDVISEGTEQCGRSIWSWCEVSAMTYRGVRILHLDIHEPSAFFANVPYCAIRHGQSVGRSDISKADRRCWRLRSLSGTLGRSCWCALGLVSSLG